MTLNVVVAAFLVFYFLDLWCRPPEFARFRVELDVPDFYPAANFGVVQEHRIWGWAREYSDYEGMDSICVGAGWLVQFCWLTPTNDPFYEPPTDPRS